MPTTYVHTGNDLLGVKPPTFDWEAPDLSKQFKTFKRYCELMLGTPTYANKSKADIVSYILLWLGPEAVEIFDNMKFDDETQKQDPTEVWNAFLNYFEPKSNYRLARFQLREITQAPSESIDSFVTRLKVQAQRCNFGNTEQMEDHLVDQIIMGVAHDDIRRKLLNQNPSKLTLDSVLEFSRTYEATSSQMHSFGKSISELRNKQYCSRSRSRHRYSRGSGKTSNNRQDLCKFCGSGNFHTRDKCPAREDSCNKCRKIGHWGKVCLSTKEYTTDTPQRGAHGVSRGRSRGRGQRNGRSQRGRAPQRGIHEMSDQPVEQVAESFEQITFNAVTGSNFRNKRSEAYATVAIKYKKAAKLRGKVDTGAQGNVLPLRTFRQMFPNQLDRNGTPTSTSKSDVKLTAYNGTRIPQYGTLNLQCKYQDGVWINLIFYVADTPGPVIFGLQSCVELGLVQMNCEVNEQQNGNTPIQTATQLRDAYPDRFKGLGHFQDKQKLVLKPDANPVIHAPRRAPIQLHDKIKEELQRMTQLGVIRPISEPTDWVSSITYVHKANGSLRICLDPKDLNANLKRAQQHIPTMEELTHRFARAKVFSKLDAKSGYWAVELDDESQILTTFNSPFGRFCFRRLPFGLKVSGDIFNASMQKILDGLQGVISIHDDVTVYGEGETIEEATQDHDRNLRKLMDRAREHNLVFNFDKTVISQPEIVFFGNVYGCDGVRPDPAKVQAINDLKPPTDTKELQSFLGMCTYLAPYIPNLSEKTTHLRSLLKQDNEFQWNPEQDRAFREIKQEICHAGNLAYFDPNKPSVVKVDASQHALGAALTQEGKPIAYASKSLTDTESRYANIERELLACVFGAERFHTYLYGKAFLIESDHKPLEMISRKNLTAAPARLQRMLLRLQRYDYDIKYVPGRDMTLPDSLSRLPKNTVDPQIELNINVSYVQFSTPKLAELRTATENDDELVTLKRFISQGFPAIRHEIPKKIRHYWSFRDQLSIDDGLIIKGEQILIPSTLRKDYLSRIHEAHQGITRCQQRARATVYWPGINEDIDNLVKTCLTCQTYQKSQSKEKLHPIIPDTPNIPWHTLGTDLFEVNGKNYLVIADYHSKFPIVEQMNSQSSRAVADSTKKVFSLFGNPNTIICDNGGCFIGSEYREMIDELGIVLITSSPKHAKSHGFIEAMVQIAQSLIRKSPKATSEALLAYRTTPLGPGMLSPAELLFNRKIGHRLPVRSQSFANDQHRDQQSAKYSKSESYYNEHARTLSDLYIGQSVFYQDAAKRNWAPGRIVGIGPEPRSYTLECTLTGRKLRRNRQLVRPRHVTFASDLQKAPMIPSNTDVPVNKTPLMTPNSDVPLLNGDAMIPGLDVPVVPAAIEGQRPQRQRKSPAWRNDYVP